MISDDVVWCARCGSYGGERAKGLAQPCPGRVLYGRRSGRTQQLAALRSGRHPRTGAALGDPRLLDLSEASSCSASPPVSDQRVAEGGRAVSMCAAPAVSRLEALRRRIVAKEASAALAQ